MTLTDRLDICEAVWPGTRAAGSLACSRALGAALKAVRQIDRGAL